MDGLEFHGVLHLLLVSCCVDHADKHKLQNVGTPIKLQLEQHLLHWNHSVQHFDSLFHRFNAFEINIHDSELD